MATSPLKFQPKGCTLPGTDYAIKVKSPGNSYHLAPDQAQLRWSVSDWVPVPLELDGCPGNLPPGTACVMKVRLDEPADQERLAAGETFDRIALMWSDGDFDDVELIVDPCGES